jgi:hypothetical protein
MNHPGTPVNLAPGARHCRGTNLIRQRSTLSSHMCGSFGYPNEFNIPFSLRCISIGFAIWNISMACSMSIRRFLPSRMNEPHITIYDGWGRLYDFFVRRCMLFSVCLLSPEAVHGDESLPLSFHLRFQSLTIHTSNASGEQIPDSQ